MLSLDQLKEIRGHLENSQNPLFFFDNDVDGLCSFLILRRSIGRGKGVAIKSYPELSDEYLRKIDELNPDSIFILDKAEVSRKFIERVNEKNLPIIWIDHHETKTPKEFVNKTYYYNPFPASEPTTYIAYKVYERKEDMWIAMIGCIGEVFMPEFAREFEKENPELFNSKLSAFEALHKTEIGKLVLMLNFGQMDTTTNVINLIKYLFKANNVYDILEENTYTKQLHKRYSELSEFYNKQIKKAEESFDKNSPILFLSYSGETSMSSIIAGKLLFNHPDKLIVVAFTRPDKVNISIRGENAKKITQKVVERIKGLTGGGHEQATGMMVPIDKFEKFKEEIESITNKHNP